MNWLASFELPHWLSRTPSRYSCLAARPRPDSKTLPANMLLCMYWQEAVWEVTRFFSHINFRRTGSYFIQNSVSKKKFPEPMKLSLSLRYTVKADGSPPIAGSCSEVRRWNFWTGLLVWPVCAINRIHVANTQTDTLQHTLTTHTPTGLQNQSPSIRAYSHRLTRQSLWKPSLCSLHLV